MTLSHQLQLVNLQIWEKTQDFFNDSHINSTPRSTLMCNKHIAIIFEWGEYFSVILYTHSSKYSTYILYLMLHRAWFIFKYIHTKREKKMFELCKYTDKHLDYMCIAYRAHTHFIFPSLSLEIQKHYCF